MLILNEKMKIISSNELSYQNFLYFSKIVHPVYTLAVSTLTSYSKHFLLSLLILAYVGSPLATS